MRGGQTSIRCLVSDKQSVRTAPLATGIRDRLWCGEWSMEYYRRAILLDTGHHIPTVRPFKPLFEVARTPEFFFNQDCSNASSYVGSSSRSSSCCQRWRDGFGGQHAGFDRGMRTFMREAFKKPASQPTKTPPLKYSFGKGQNPARRNRTRAAG